MQTLLGLLGLALSVFALVELGHGARLLWIAGGSISLALVAWVGLCWWLIRERPVQ
jgi:hypothetical protein